MRLQQKKGQYYLHIPKHMVCWLLWEKGDDVIVRLCQDTLSIGLSCFAKYNLKAELLKKEKLVSQLQRERDLKEQLRAYESRIAELKAEISKKQGNDALHLEVEKRGKEVEVLEHEKEFEELS